MLNKTSLVYIWRRIVCFFGSHNWSPIEREKNIGKPYVSTLPAAPGETVNVIRQDFSAKRFCLHCHKTETHRGYDASPPPGDKFLNAEKTPQNSKNSYFRKDEFGNLAKITESEFLKLTNGKMPHE